MELFMALSHDKAILLKNRIQRKIEQNPILIKEFGLTNMHELSTLPIQQLEEKINAKILSILGLSKKDLGII